MATTTEKNTSPIPAAEERHNLPIFKIADPDEVQTALDAMFEAYVYRCLDADENQHYTVVCVYYAFKYLLKERAEKTALNRH